MSLNPSSTLSLRLAEFVAGTGYDQLSQPALDAARRSLVNFLGVTIGGAHHEETQSALASVEALGAGGPFTVIGRSERLDAMSAALVNGIGSAVLDFDATQMKHTNIHPSGPVLPALLAITELRNVSGRDFIAAFVLGTEIACRLANHLLGGKNPGWHVTGITGGVGAAAGAAKLLGLDPPAMVAAMGIAANQAAGLREMYGTACKALTPGRAARDGLLAAVMASHGFSAPARPIEGGKGLARVYADMEAPEELAADLGAGFEIELNVFKPYPCAIVTHAVIDGVAAICRDSAVVPGAIARIELTVSPVAIQLAGHMDPQTPLQSKFSLSQAAALAAVHHDARVAHFSRMCLEDTTLRDLRAKVVARPQEGYRKNEAFIRIVLEDGRTLERRVEHALGSLENPMSDADIAGKYRSLATGVIGPAQTEQLLDAIINLAACDDASLLVRYASRLEGRS
ncbi:2-methylcitrate dehydratase PrpD [Ancylobacter aquaticus]|uniref:2-methylcitrate dehydratase PrpD n=1 Tax=Ancylobacter aquaticus TaxID=100 RepID=A0A4R1I516_ANCAQ|nr:MmgE/PrpD family protein [Ancylobacter aquaticus]TCK30407.1 2-methylcitrate dehydratase PrpD [Ancylobacter aquaticus]